MSDLFRNHIVGFPTKSSNVFKLDITSIKVMTSVIKCLQIRLNFSDTRYPENELKSRV